MWLKECNFNHNFFENENQTRNFVRPCRFSQTVWQDNASFPHFFFWVMVFSACHFGKQEDIFSTLFFFGLSCFPLVILVNKKTSGKHGYPNKSVENTLTQKKMKGVFLKGKKNEQTNKRKVRLKTWARETWVVLDLFVYLFLLFKWRYGMLLE